MNKDLQKTKRWGWEARSIVSKGMTRNGSTAQNGQQTLQAVLRSNGAACTDED